MVSHVLLHATLESIHYSAHHCRVFDKLPALPKPLPTPQSLPVADKAPDVPDTLADVTELRLVQLPRRPDGEVIDWSAPLREAWDISESGALNIMEQFLSEGGWQPAGCG